MASKKEVYGTVVEAVSALCDKYSVNEKVREGLNGILAEYLAPKSGGNSIDLGEVTRVDENGNVTHLLCSVSKVWLPATSEYFYEDKDGKGINGLKRLSRQAEAIRKQHFKVISTSEKAILADVLAGNLTPDEAKAELEAIKSKVVDYSTVTE